MTARYMFLDSDGNVIAEIIDQKILEEIGGVSGFIIDGKNYLYAHWLWNGEYFFFQEAGKLVDLPETAIERREKVL